MKQEEKDVKHEVVVPSATQEEVTSNPEVKVDEEKVSKMQEQIDNLNTALKQERENKKSDVDKVEALTQRLEESQQTIDKLKNVFVPKEEEEDPQAEFLTEEQFEHKWKQKEEELLNKQKAESQTEMYNKQIQSLEKEWDGKDGRPVYNDTEVLQWQQKNNKVYLSPEEAFYAMYRDDIIDYEVRKKGLPSQDVEQPSGASGARQPEQQPIKDTRNAVLEAIQNAEKEM